MHGIAKLFLVSAFIISATAALADPPAHAPAHGWRKKHDPHYVGYTGKQWDRDYDIASGRCNRQEIATVIGGIAGGVIAARVAEPDNRAVATVIGAIAGAVIGNRIGRELDEADRGCFGHALEIAQPGQRVTWTNETAGVRYELSPGTASPGSGANCRQYTLVTIVGRDRATRQGVACEAQPGVWQASH